MCFRKSVFSSCTEDTSNDIAVVKKNCEQLRRLQLLVQWFNQTHSWPIFQLKVTVISITLLSGYSTVRHWSDEFLFTFINFCTTLIGYIIFAVVYDKTFTIPSKVHKAKKFLTMRAKTLTAENMEVLSLVAFLRSVPLIGVQIGIFQRMKRTSTPEFIDFTVRTTARLLLANR